METTHLRSTAKLRTESKPLYLVYALMAWTGENLHLHPQGIELQILERQTCSLVTVRLSYRSCYFFLLPPTKFRNVGLASIFRFPLPRPPPPPAHRPPLSVTNDFSLLVLQIDAV